MGEAEEEVYILIVGLNEGVGAGEVLENATLNELCETDSVCWQRIATPSTTAGGATSVARARRRLSMSWANYDVSSENADEETVVCCGRDEGRAGDSGWGGISFYYPRHLQDFHCHREQSLFLTNQGVAWRASQQERRSI